MPWAWELPDWPQFSYNSKKTLPLERKFLQGAGGVFAILKHLDHQKKKQFIIEILSVEGQSSSEIEGEILKRESLQSSIRRHFGLTNDHKISPKERGMGDLMWSVYDTYNHPLTHEMLFEWHHLLMKGSTRLSDIGKYRSHKEAMQIISGRLDKPTVFYEAPPSNKVHKEMSQFIKWFNNSNREENIVAKASIAHVYFEMIHPFEDGNGRIGRALVEKALSKILGHPTLIAVSQAIATRKKEYYSALGASNRTLKIDHWLNFFSEIILTSQNESLLLVHFLMAKTKLMDRLKNQINKRQEKALLRLFAEGPKGFVGGLSAENYIAITKTSRPTASRDLADLVKKKALYKTGELKYTRYFLNLHFK